MGHVQLYPVEAGLLGATSSGGKQTGQDLGQFADCFHLQVPNPLALSVIERFPLALAEDFLQRRIIELRQDSSQVCLIGSTWGELLQRAPMGFGDGEELPEEALFLGPPTDA